MCIFYTKSYGNDANNSLACGCRLFESAPDYCESYKVHHPKEVARKWQKSYTSRKLTPQWNEGQFFENGVRYILLSPTGTGMEFPPIDCPDKTFYNDPALYSCPFHELMQRRAKDFNKDFMDDQKGKNAEEEKKHKGGFFGRLFRN